MKDADCRCSGCHDAFEWKAERAQLRKELEYLKNNLRTAIIADSEAECQRWKQRAERAEDTLGEWQSATGLQDSGGDPSGLTPAMLEDYQCKMQRVVEAAKFHVEHCPWAEALKQALDALKPHSLAHPVDAVARD